MSHKTHPSSAHPSSPLCQLTDGERRALRRAKIRLKNLDQFSALELKKMTDIPLSRAQELISLCLFQRLSSVGPATAEDLYRLGYRSLDDLKTASPPAMHEKLCRMTGQKVDLCVEDVFRCAVAQAQDETLDLEKKNWWYWSDFRGQE